MLSACLGPNHQAWCPICLSLNPNKVLPQKKTRMNSCSNEPARSNSVCSFPFVSVCRWSGTMRGVLLWLPSEEAPAQGMVPKPRSPVPMPRKGHHPFLLGLTLQESFPPPPKEENRVTVRGCECCKHIRSRGRELFVEKKAGEPRMQSESGQMTYSQTRRKKTWLPNRHLHPTQACFSFTRRSELRSWDILPVRRLQQVPFLEGTGWF